MRNIVILISGSGSNMAAIVRVARGDDWAARWGARIVAVVSNRADAGGLRLAADEGIDTCVLDHRQYPTRDAFDEALAERIAAYDSVRCPALVVLAGFMRILTPGFVERHRGRLLNIHPSLLPAFPGLHTHQRALDAGCAVAGATVHEVTSELDQGPILAQAVVPVLPGDTAASLAARVLSQEHLLYPRAIAAWLEQRTAD